MSSSRPIALASRTYTNRTGGGTLGFGAPPLRPAELHGVIRTLAGVRANDGYRSSIGLVSGPTGASVTLRLRDADGRLLGTAEAVWVAPRSLLQLSLAAAFPGAPLPAQVGSVEVVPDRPIAAYLSVVDGSSQDPVLVVAP